MARKKRKSTQSKSATQSTGGVTGSHRIELEGKYHQEKNSLRDKGFFNARRIKAAGTDRENLGEVVAACHASAYLGEEHAPNVQTYYDAERKHVEITSEYLENTQGTMDEYYVKHLNGSLSNRKHVLLVLTDEPNPKSTKNEWHIHPDTPLAKTLARASAAAAILGDHDLNPGNRVVIKQGDSAPTIGSIDFGHAFNDLIHAPSVVGGRIRLPDNPIFDFFNRSSVAGFRPGGDVSKFWRDYKGFIPSELLGDALIELGENKEAQQKGLLAAKAEFNALFKLIAANSDDTESKAYVIKSFNEIHHAITGTFFPTQPKKQANTDQENIKLFFKAIEQFIQKNAENAVFAGKMMKQQAALTEALHADIDNLDTFSEHWKQIFKDETLMNSKGALLYPWFKRDMTEKPFQGTFEAYIINERNKYLNAKHAEEMKHANPNSGILSSIIIQFNQLVDYIANYLKTLLGQDIQIEKNADIGKTLEQITTSEIPEDTPLTGATPAA
ncbi:MAG: hypothetical protein K0U37_06595 [Gammaproteobacteria bacterium]|nr:hypothetical protein [Gammaproteobacteria bacterium]